MRIRTGRTKPKFRTEMDDEHGEDDGGLDSGRFVTLFPGEKALGSICEIPHRHEAAISGKKYRAQSWISMFTYTSVTVRM